MSYELDTADRHQAEAQGTHLPRTGTINLCSGPTPSFPYKLRRAALALPAYDHLTVQINKHNKIIQCKVIVQIT